jgi:hypothetical protein
MDVTNATEHTLIAVCFDTTRGCGDDVTIFPGETVPVKGPYLGAMGGGACYVHVPGTIVCHEGPDTDEAFQVGPGNPLTLLSDDAEKSRGVVVCFPEDLILILWCLG